MSAQVPRRVVVTGLGAVSPFGATVAALWDGVRAGRSGVSGLDRDQRFDASAYPTRIGAVVPALDARLPAARDGGGDWLLEIARRACAEALAMAGAPPEAAIGLAIGTGTPPFTHREQVQPLAEAETANGMVDVAGYVAARRRIIGPTLVERQSSGRLAAQLAAALDLGGPLAAVDTACAASADAIAVAHRWIRGGRARMAVAGGAAPLLSPTCLAMFSILGTLSRRNDEPAAASRPFDADRDGFVPGEGAGFLVLEDAEHARRRGAPPIAELLGCGSACDAYRVTDPHPDGRGAILAMRRALATAGVEPGAVGYVNAHGTGTRANDPIESRAIEEVFGAPDHCPPVSSTKSMIGHLLEGAGAVEAIITVLALRDSVLPPTLNLDRADPECRLDYVPHHARAAPIEVAMSNSFGFGGQCASLVFARAEGGR